MIRGGFEMFVLCHDGIYEEYVVFLNFLCSFLFVISYKVQNER